MSEENKYELNDLVVAALDQKPMDFEAAFDDLIVDRIRTAVENKKIEIAQQMYDYDSENDDEFGEADFDTDSGEEEDGEVA